MTVIGGVLAAACLASGCAHERQRASALMGCREDALSELSQLTTEEQQEVDAVKKWNKERHASGGQAAAGAMVAVAIGALFGVGVPSFSGGGQARLPEPIVGWPHVWVGCDAVALCERDGECRLADWLRPRSTPDLMRRSVAVAHEELGISACGEPPEAVRTGPLRWDLHLCGEVAACFAVTAARQFECFRGETTPPEARRFSRQLATDAPRRDEGTQREQLPIPPPPAKRFAEEDAPAADGGVQLGARGDDEPRATTAGDAPALRTAAPAPPPPRPPGAIVADAGKLAFAISWGVPAVSAAVYFVVRGLGALIFLAFGEQPLPAQSDLAAVLQLLPVAGPIATGVLANNTATTEFPYGRRWRPAWFTLGGLQLASLATWLVGALLPAPAARPAVRLVPSAPGTEVGASLVLEL